MTVDRRHSRNRDEHERNKNGDRTVPSELADVFHVGFGKLHAKRNPLHYLALRPCYSRCKECANPKGSSVARRLLGLFGATGRQTSASKEYLGNKAENGFTQVFFA